MLFAGQVVEGVCVASEDDGGRHAREPTVEAGEPSEWVHCLAKDVWQGEL